ncbi:hypothetical protein Cni_G24578 [Canna indica]|uniref:Uncharacterized protein n=1 Tax=Canna indica TaxID=4628 RepID=A0AAQ3L2N0_9LILI|nr:hypothetical protein Cni_G24578 [Canna indica]
MAFFTHWYDLLSLAMVVAAALGSLWAIKVAGKGGDGDDDGDKCESLLASGGGEEGAIAAAPASLWREQLWMSQWQAVHPAVLLGLRAAAAATMSGVLVWDLWTYDWSIMLYYTE